MLQANFPAGLRWKRTIRFWPHSWDENGRLLGPRPSLCPAILSLWYLGVSSEEAGKPKGIEQFKSNAWPLSDVPPELLPLDVHTVFLGFLWTD